MPTIARFAGCRIEMYFGDHPPPHFHIVSPNGTMKLTIQGHRVLAGNLPKRAIKDALEWAAANEAILMDKWTEFREKEQQR